MTRTAQYLAARRVAILASSLVPLLCLLIAFSAVAAAAKPSSAAATATGVSGAAATAASVDGFRSAKFGMDESQVYAAIKSDFGIKQKDVVAGTNPAERTKLLTVTVPDLLKDGGTAQVSYVFGYTSHKLIQVGASWSRTTDPKMTKAKLQADGEVLRAYFLKAGYDPATIQTNVVVKDGLLLFRGLDGAGHATIVLLQGPFTKNSNQKQVLTPVSLALLYSVDPDHPDVFKIKPGNF